MTSFERTPDHERRPEVRRRQFLKAAGAAVAVPYFVPSGVLASPGKPGANDRLTVAHIGVGGMGSGHLQRMTQFRDEGKVNIAAVCDVDENRLASAVKMAGAGCSRIATIATSVFATTSTRSSSPRPIIGTPCRPFMPARRASTSTSRSRRRSRCGKVGRW